MTTTRVPLTAFEELLFWINRPAYPCSCFARMHFSGRVDRGAFESAVRMAIPRHPLLQSQVVAKGRRLAWQLQPDSMPEIRWLSGMTGAAFPTAPYQDLRIEIGLRLFVVEDGDSCDVTAQFHHACCDGAGIQTLLSDILVGYAMAKSEQASQLRLPKLDPAPLARRGAYGLTFGKLTAMLPRQIAGLPGAFWFFSRSPSPLLPHRAPTDDGPALKEFPATCTHVFDREETLALNDAARRLDVTVNDLLARDLYLALGEWRKRHLGRNENDWLRVMIPINMRSAQDRLLPAANMVGAIFLDRRSQDFGRPDTLLAGIASELRLIRDYRLGMIFLYALNLLGLFPRGLRSIARRDRCMVSAIFSNLGRPLQRCGLPRENGQIIAANLALRGTDGTVPLPKYNCASFTAMEYARHLSMTLHYDSRFITAEQANDLLSTFVARIRATTKTTGDQ